MNFTKVSKALADAWSNLSVNEKEKYKHLASERKKLLPTGKLNDAIQPPKKTFEFVFKNLKRHSTLINVELSDIKKNIFESSKMP